MKPLAACTDSVATQRFVAKPDLRPADLSQRYAAIRQTWKAWETSVCGRELAVAVNATPLCWFVLVAYGGIARAWARSRRSNDVLAVRSRGSNSLVSVRALTTAGIYDSLGFRSSNAVFGATNGEPL